MKILSHKGLTLVEVMLTAALIGVVGLGLIAILGSAQNFLMQSTGMATTQGEASYAHAHLKRYVALANRIIIYNGTEFAIRYDHRSITGGTATPLNSDDDEWDYYGYDPADGILYYRSDFVPGASANPANPGFVGAQVIARHITVMTFTLVSPDQLDVDVTVTRTIGTQTRTSRVVSSISPRGMVIN